MERYPGLAGESRDRLAAVADEMIARRDDFGKRGAYGSPVDLGQDRIEGRALPVAGDENGNVVLMKAGVPGRPAAFAKPCATDRTSGP